MLEALGSQVTGPVVRIPTVPKGKVQMEQGKTRMRPEGRPRAERQSQRRPQEKGERERWTTGRLAN